MFDRAAWDLGWATVDRVKRRYPLRYVSVTPYFPAPEHFVFIKKGGGKPVLTSVPVALEQMRRWKMRTMRDRKRRVTAAVTPVSE